VTVLEDGGRVSKGLTRFFFSLRLKDAGTRRTERAPPGPRSTKSCNVLVHQHPKTGFGGSAGGEPDSRTTERASSIRCVNGRGAPGAVLPLRRGRIGSGPRQCGQAWSRSAAGIERPNRLSYPCGAPRAPSDPTGAWGICPHNNHVRAARRSIPIRPNSRVGELFSQGGCETKYAYRPAARSGEWSVEAKPSRAGRGRRLGRHEQVSVPSTALLRGAGEGFVPPWARQKTLEKRKPPRRGFDEPSPRSARCTAGGAT